jgi:hypothetical protein
MCEWPSGHSTSTEESAVTRIVGEHFRADGKPKRKFKTRQAATTYAKRYVERYAERDRCSDKEIYECSVCHGFHFATIRGGR